MTYALDRVHQAPWADQSRIVMAGQSEGAVALAGFTGGGYQVAILQGFNCKVYETTVRIPPDIPVLSLQDPMDPVFMTTNRGTGTCASALRGRAGSYVVEFPDAGHNVFDKPALTKAPEAVLAFLGNHGLIVKPLPKSAMPRPKSPPTAPPSSP